MKYFSLVRLFLRDFSQYSGFTLMELMIVIAIIGILVAIAIPSYHIYTRRAHFTEIVQAAAPFKLGVEECDQINGSLDNCTAGQNGIPPNIENSNSAGLIQSIVVSGKGVITITPKNKYGITSKDTFILTPTEQNGVVIWKSSGGAVEAGYAS